MKHMKRTRWGALLLAILMLANAMASGVMTVFAEDEITPVLLIDGGSLNPISGSNCTGAYDYEAGYITLTATGDDPYYSFNMIKADANGGTLVGPYLSIKYRVDAKYAGMQGEFFASTNYHHAGQVEDGSDKFRFDYECDGEWHVITMYLPDMMGDHYNLESNTLNFFRNDFIYAAANGYSVDVEYYAFFDSLSDAEGIVRITGRISPSRRRNTRRFCLQAMPPFSPLPNLESGQPLHALHSPDSPSMPILPSMLLQSGGKLPPLNFSL